MKDDNQKKFICDCGKEFETQVSLSHHKTHCEIFQTNKKQKALEEKESRRLPNGMFKCENPKCGKEHDGSYGSGRFCCKKCRDVFIGIESVKSAIKNGTFVSNFKKRKDAYKNAQYGTWKCNQCGFIAKTRAELYKHKNDLEHKDSCKGRSLPQWHKDKISQALLGKPGHKFTPEQRIKARKAALKRTVPVSTKKTEDYICKDGTIVRLDSSYERIVARILDDNDIKWIRPAPLDWYSEDGIKHHYYPDFYLVDYNIYLDPKNEYCFKVQSEKINYILSYYDNCIFLHKEQLTKENIFEILEEQQGRGCNPAVY